jgi:dipeptidyl-peptidase 4
MKYFTPVKGFFLVFVLAFQMGMSQDVVWNKDGNSSYMVTANGIVKVTLPSMKEDLIMARSRFKSSKTIKSFSISADEKFILIYCNSKKVWRYETRGDYYLVDLVKETTTQIGIDKPESTLMFAKMNDNVSKVAYVCQSNVYIYDVASNTSIAVTKNGQRRFINGTFDWVYEEEFDCRDGIRWSPDGSKLLYWEVDATPTRDFYMINNTDSVYSRIIPIEYPKVGEAPSTVRLITYDVASKKNTPLQITGDKVLKFYLPAAEFTLDSKEIIIQQLDRKQQVSNLWVANASTGAAKIIYTEKDEAWIDSKNSWDDGLPNGWLWLDGGKSFLWLSEKDGWRHAYKISRDGKTETKLTNDEFDVIELKGWNEKTGDLYFTASPKNATQSYLYSSSLKNPKKAAYRVTPSNIEGTCYYDINPNATYAEFYAVGSKMIVKNSWINLPKHTTTDGTAFDIKENKNNKAEFFQVTTSEGVTMDGWMIKPDNFDPSKKYPVLFYVYGEPASCTVKDNGTPGRGALYNESLAKAGYIYMSLDNRGTPAPKGRAWRKAIYRKIGQLNIKDQALAATEVLKFSFVDPKRIAIYGWSGGGATTLNAMFQYPEIYKTGIAVAAITNELNYDNIYTERYMGLPQENMEDFTACSPITYAKNLQGNLLYIHGTGDDNVHYQNAEQLINELIKQNKQFSFMPYPNRTHGISEGVGTRKHLSTIFSNFLNTHCPGGER